MRKPKKVYDDEFKETIRELYNTGKDVTTLSEEYGLPPSYKIFPSRDVTLKSLYSAAVSILPNPTPPFIKLSLFSFCSNNSNWDTTTFSPTLFPNKLWTW